MRGREEQCSTSVRRIALSLYPPSHKEHCRHKAQRMKRPACRRLLTPCAWSLARPGVGKVQLTRHPAKGAIHGAQGLQRGRCQQELCLVPGRRQPEPGEPADTGRAVAE